MLRLSRVLRGALALAPMLVLLAGSSAQAVELKIATLAPDGSSWAKIMAEGGRKIAAATDNRVTVKYFFSGVQGDERDVVRKIKLGQIDGAALTAVGLGLIKSDVRILELPFLFKNDTELDHVRSKMAPEFEKQFDEAGYVLLAWGDVGWTYLYSNIPVNSKEDLAKTKMWAWTDDPIVRTFFKRLGVNGVPLGVPDVLTSLQTGTIDACYGSPLAAVALGWYAKVKFATDTPISYSIGALVVRKEVFNKLSPEDQKTVREQGTEIGAHLMEVVRRDNDKAAKAMKGSGVKFVATPAPFVADLEKEGKGVWADLSTGSAKLYSPDLLEKVKKSVAEVRK